MARGLPSRYSVMRTRSPGDFRAILCWRSLADTTFSPSTSVITSYFSSPALSAGAPPVTLWMNAPEISGNPSDSASSADTAWISTPR